MWLVLTSKKALSSGVWTEKRKLHSVLDSSNSLAATVLSRKKDLTNRHNLHLHNSILVGVTEEDAEDRQDGEG